MTQLDRGAVISPKVMAVGMLSAYAFFFFVLVVWRFRKMEA